MSLNRRRKTKSSPIFFREIYKAGRIPDIQLLRRFIRFLLRKPVSAFSTFIARIDALVGECGFSFAAKIALQELAGGAQSQGAGQIPQDGPLIIASNHPGTYDGFVLISNLERDDFKMMVSGIPFFQNLPHASKYLIYSTHDVHDRMEAIRRSIAHLEKAECWSFSRAEGLIRTLRFFPALRRRSQLGQGVLRFLCAKCHARR